MKTYMSRFLLILPLLLASPVPCRASELDELRERLAAIEERLESLEKSLKSRIADTGVKQKKEVEPERNSNWDIALQLDNPNLIPPATQYAVFDEDPIPEFRASLKRILSYHQKKLEEAKTEADRKLARSILLKVQWD